MRDDQSVVSHRSSRSERSSRSGYSRSSRKSYSRGRNSLGVSNGVLKKVLYGNKPSFIHMKEALADTVRETSSYGLWNLVANGVEKDFEKPKKPNAKTGTDR